MGTERKANIAQRQSLQIHTEGYSQVSQGFSIQRSIKAKCKAHLGNRKYKTAITKGL